MSSPKRRRVAWVAVLALLTACGIQQDDEPRTIAGAEPVVGPDAGSGSASEGADLIYLVAPGSSEPRMLRSVQRSARSTADLIEILLSGPNEAELEDQWTSLIPTGTVLLSSRRQGATLFLDLTAELTSLPSTEQRYALAQIVYTAAEVDGVAAVQITIDGEPEALPKGDGESTTSVLRTYDYPGVVASAQPAFPALPSG